MPSARGTVTIVDAQPEDAPLLAEISKRAFESDIEVGASAKGGPQGYDSKTAHRRDVESDYLDYIKILFNGELVGGMRVFRANDAGQYDIWGVFVDPEYHRRGIASRAFRLVMDRYPEAKIWTLDTPEWNVRTRRFYQDKLGFAKRGILRWEQDFDLIYYELLVDETYEHPLTPLAELVDGLKGLAVEGLVTSVGNIKKVYSKRDGKNHMVAEAGLQDGTGTATLTLWDDFIRQVRKGERVRIERAYTSMYDKELFLNVSRYGRLVILTE